MKTYRLWAPLVRQPEEPIATLTYGDVTFEIPTSLMHHLSGWLILGSHECKSPLSGAQLTIQAFKFLEKVMLYDATPPSQEAIDFYGEDECRRPTLPDDFKSDKPVYEMIEEMWADRESSDDKLFQGLYGG